MADTSELREEAARIIYDAFPYKGEVFPPTKPEWVTGGNSIMQTEARRAAAKILALPGLQAEAPEDAEVAEAIAHLKAAIAKSDAHPTRVLAVHVSRNHAGVILNAIQSRTSQAEAQAPAVTLTDDDIEVLKSAWCREAWNTVTDSYHYSCNYCAAPDVDSASDEIKHTPDCLTRRLIKD